MSKKYIKINNLYYNVKQTIMDKKLSILLLLAIHFVFIQNASGQKKTTYDYKYLYTIDKNGEKHSNYGSVRYITFSEDAKTCYTSDENGRVDSWALYGSYQEENNGMRIYRAYWYVFIDNNPQWLPKYFYFSSDFSRMNLRNEDSGDTEVYEQHILEHPKQLY